MGIVLQITADVCICCKSTGPHDPRQGKSVDLYPGVIDKKKYKEQGMMMEKQIPNDWNCGKCHRLNVKGQAHCIYCDHRYQDAFRVTDDNEGEGEQSQHEVVNEQHGNDGNVMNTEVVDDHGHDDTVSEKT